MIKRQLPKEIFTFTLGSGQPMGVEDIDSLSFSTQLAVRSVYQNWLETNKQKEREWRNERLAETDWMMIPDATYDGLPLSGSARLQDITDYRNQLRMYNLTTDERPTPPTWYKG